MYNSERVYYPTEPSVVLYVSELLVNKHTQYYESTPFLADGPNLDAGKDKLLRAQSGRVPKGGRYGH